MELLLKRFAKKSEYTIGNLYVNGIWFCNTLEDVDRKLKQSMSEEEIADIKVYGKTAIPTGKYNVDITTISSTFKNRSWAKPHKGIVPRIKDVPGFKGVLIHPGNTAEDSLGCILVGENKVKGQVVNSVNTYKKLFNLLKDIEDDITLTIE